MHVTKKHYSVTVYTTYAALICYSVILYIQYVHYTGTLQSQSV